MHITPFSRSFVSPPVGTDAFLLFFLLASALDASSTVTPRHVYKQTAVSC